MSNAALRPIPAFPVIAPSILAADFTRLGEEIAAVDSAGWIHVDIMDGHFVPNLSFGADILRAARRSSEKIMDVHLMIEDPERWVDSYIDAGADTVIFHVEATDNPVALADYLRGKGVRAGISLKPGTPVDVLLDDLEHYDLVLVMSVEPGFGGQSFMPEQVEKVAALREAIDARGLDTIIEIDGGISADTIAHAAAAGCDAFVAGSAVYKADNPDAEVQRLHALAAGSRPGA
ncbi:ribulose-phosphate 3-epimerase [Corynebacterium sp. 13CS0277]|uniref:ribulose-phosphate 3-epimerase n=1 Tax=Corynebacterium sp. 13CS0277 TaxID=2071994 RepID=UPI000D03FFB5|nr:ribulose-phosphate 3-epimerase [Corynebacterium sp. 13CS0277]PRQ11932.1 ribulose-phosphate 3-epimerase [Corynebacterium sp. 13CS0277]